jgi:hypothetical protein
MRREDLVKPAGQGAFLEAEPTLARDGFDGRDQRLRVGLDDV